MMWFVPTFRAEYRPKLVHLAVEYRAAILVGFACPMSVLVRIWNGCKNKWAETFARPEDHDARVAAVQAQVQRWSESGKQRHMCSARSNWQNLSTRFVDKSVMHKIQLANLRDVLDVDTENLLVRVEPNVTGTYLSGSSVGCWQQMAVRFLAAMLSRETDIAFCSRVHHAQVGSLWLHASCLSRAG